MASRSGVDISGLAETLQALKIIDPTVRKESLKPISAVGRDIAAKARKAVPNRPARNWGGWQRRGEPGDSSSLGWDAAVVKSGIKYLAGGQRMNMRLVNKSPAGAVYETAGQKGNYSTPQGAVLVRNMDRFGIAPRGLVKTWRDQKGVTRFAGAIRRATVIAEDKVNEVVR
jgi:hypothetical protein